MSRRHASLTGMLALAALTGLANKSVPIERRKEPDTKLRYTVPDIDPRQKPYGKKYRRHNK